MLFKKSSLDLNLSEMVIMMGVDVKIFIVVLICFKIFLFYIVRIYIFENVSCYLFGSRICVFESIWNFEYRLFLVLEMFEES